MKKKSEMVIFGADRVKDLVLSVPAFEGEKDSLLKELGEKILPALVSGDKGERESVVKKMGEKTMELMRIFENETHVGLMETFTDRYRMLSSDMSKTMIKEYACNNEAERALVALAVNAYIRVLDNSRRLNNELECRDITANRNVYIANLSKQLDRANRQYISALMTLQHIKSPSVEMNIKVNTAFVAHNQQVNIQKDETITPQ